jgi:hypothetical protein
LDRIAFHDSFPGWPRRSPGNGGMPSQPQPEPKSGRSPSGGRPGGSGGRAADEAAARRKLRACPLADAKAAGFVKRPSVSSRPSGRREAAGGTPDLRVQDQPGGKRDFGLSAATGGEGASALALPGRTGLRPGSCETGGPRASAHDRQAEPRLRPRIPPSTAPKLRPRDRDGGKRDASSEPPNGEPPGLRPWSGSPRGTRLRLRPEKDPGGNGAENPRFSCRHSKPPDAGRLASQARFQLRDSGGRRRRRPPLFLGALKRIWPSAQIRSS